MSAIKRDPGIVDSKFLQTCDIAVEEFKVEPFTIVIFGGAGDLSRRKLLPSLFHLYRENELSKGFSILGFDRVELNDDQYRNLMKEEVERFVDDTFDSTAWDEFAKHLFYLAGNFGSDESFQRLTEKIIDVSVPTDEGRKDVIYYMAVPPQIMPLAVGKLRLHDLCKGVFRTKIIVEKPFGRDRASASELNKILTGSSPSPRYSASTTTSARNRSKTYSFSVFEHDFRTPLEQPLHR